MRIRIQKTRASEGCNNLRQELISRGHDVKYLRSEASQYTFRHGDVVINWGRQSGIHTNALNYSARNAGDKVRAFERFRNYASFPHPDFSTEIEEAGNWVDEGSTVVCRTLTRGSSGRGIVLANTRDELVSAGLYTRYIKKSEEYRVHVFNGEVIDVQRKARSTDVPDEEINWQIRTHDNGFIYARSDVELPEVATDMAINAVRALDLNFGAVDMIYNRHYDSYYVLEVNSAPGLTGSTVSSYADAIERLGV